VKLFCPVEKSPAVGRKLGFCGGALSGESVPSKGRKSYRPDFQFVSRVALQFDLEGGVAFPSPRSQGGYAGPRARCRPADEQSAAIPDSGNMDQRRGNIVGSRRCHSGRYRVRTARSRSFQNLQEGQVMEGVVKNITDLWRIRRPWRHRDGPASRDRYWLGRRIQTTQAKF